MSADKGLSECLCCPGILLLGSSPRFQVLGRRVGALRLAGSVGFRVDVGFLSRPKAGPALALEGFWVLLCRFCKVFGLQRQYVRLPM